ncbi:MAG: GTP-binding protein, partial [Candidatus Omnitrophota bacterium]|nr:GTP-binding protein [Candidatus Omnitrophota bacterium]
MANIDASDARNVILFGHSGCGKTTLAEAILWKSGAIPRMGTISDGTTVSDYNEDEKEKKHSASTSLMSFSYNSIKVNIIDTPGYTDFVGEMIGGVRAADACIVVVNAASGIEIGTERAYRMAMEKGVPCVFFINMLDKEHSDYDKCFEDIRKKFRKHCVVMNMPIGKESALKNVVTIINRKGFGALSDMDKAHAEDLADKMVETIAETDDLLLERYLDKGELSLEELDSAFKKAVTKGEVTPILCGSALRDVGIAELLDMLIRYFPSSMDRPMIEGVKLGTSEKVAVAAKSDAPFSGLVFKTLSDPYLGQISMFKVFSGRLQSNSGFWNVSKGTREKIGGIFSLMGKTQIPVGSV